MPKVDLDALEPTNRTGYPPPFNEPVVGRWQRKVGEAAGLSELGARYVVLEPGAWSSQRHWHEGEDELLVMLSGSAVLVEDGSEIVLSPGDVAAWAQGRAQRPSSDQSRRRAVQLRLRQRGQGARRLLF